MIFPQFLALDIGAFNTKIIQVAPMGSKMNIKAYTMVPTPPNVIEDGKLSNIDVLAQSINLALQEKKIKEKNVVFTISGTSIITREVVLPKAGSKELKSIIEMESAQYFPVNIDSYVLDYKILEEIKIDKGAQYRILLVAVPVAIIEGYMELASLCGLNIFSIDFVGNSIVKFVTAEMKEVGKKDKEILDKTVAILDMGYKTTTVSIISKGSFQFNRILFYGSQDFTNMIANNLGLTFEEAEKLKINKAAIISSDDEPDSQEAAVISESIRATLLTFIDDVSRFFDFYNSRSTGNHIDQIYLMGGGCQVQGLESYLQFAFNTPVERIPEFKTTHYSKKMEDFKHSQIYFANCLGAVLTK
ncbi:type IV pilus assembly protein PilM [Petroclostridium sp. X23]|uniref:type IV pilus assembly protein PilM n=1 Tax=Petroclostridium sp. X23 TaxID=3045146 RepID=UPI0024ADCCE8|nr:type IV pilus assembly protein PilM [Petroclostridium sp. X23]WHH59661.1 type IV pilus assembly protein PilM [Petroclostridium sp. X23]